MAYAKIRAPSVFINGVKMGYFDESDYDYTTGDEAQFGDPGYVGHTDGAGQTKLQTGGIIPIPGLGFDIYSIMKNRTYVDISLGVVNGQVHSATMRCVQAKATGAQKAGTLKGQFSFEGGEPSIG